MFMATPRCPENAMARPLVRDKEGVSTLVSLIGVLILVIAILAVYFGFIVPKFAGPPLRARSGDDVQVDYVGRFENGLVFDTSLLAVAQDNASNPKAFAFGWHPPWQPLEVKSVGSGEVVKGFDLGIQGLAVGDATTIAVPPDLGYGAADPTKVFVKPLFESVPVHLTMDASDFSATYKAPAVSGANTTDPFWGWPATVGVSGSVVTVTNSPTPGQIVHPYGAWEARVDSIDDGANGGVGTITVHHHLDASSVDRVGFRNGNAVSFTVTAVDLAAGTYSLDYNNPVKGRTLIFEVTMVRISRVA